VERVMGIEPALAFWAKSTEWPLPGNGSRVHEGPLLAYSVEKLGFSGRVFSRLQGVESEKSQQVSVEPNRDDSGEAGTFWR
jgi:hypothetical protein